MGHDQQRGAHITNTLECLTNDIHELKKSIVDQQSLAPSSTQQSSQKATSSSAPSSPYQIFTEKVKEVVTHTFKVGNKVVHKKFGTVMKIVGIHNNRITCDRGWLIGLATYDASKLELVK